MNMIEKNGAECINARDLAKKLAYQLNHISFI